MSDVIRVVVDLDEQVRLLTAVLAASSWPEREQAIAPHAVHTQGKLTRQLMLEKGLNTHPAVALVDDCLTAGGTLATVFTAGLSDPVQESLPSPFTAVWLDQLSDVQIQSNLAAELWAEQQAVWDEALDDLNAIFVDEALADFVGRLTGTPLDRPLIVVPTLVFPMLAGVAVTTARAHYALIPPPKAWGESPPWPYRDGADWTLGEACRILSLHLLGERAEMLTAEQKELFKHAAATIFLGEALSDAEGMSYLVRARRQFKLPQLTAVVDAMREWLDSGDGDLLAVLTSDT